MIKRFFFLTVQGTRFLSLHQYRREMRNLVIIQKTSLTKDVTSTLQKKHISHVVDVF